MGVMPLPPQAESKKSFLVLFFKKELLSFSISYLESSMKAIVTVMLKDGVLDPQGKAIGHALNNLGFAQVGDVRAGKIIELELAETDAAAAKAAAEDMAKKLLANSVIESFRVEIAG
jgi:phosphoribosylformylglycinamidine synthase